MISLVKLELENSLCEQEQMHHASVHTRPPRLMWLVASIYSRPLNPPAPVRSRAPRSALSYWSWGRAPRCCALYRSSSSSQCVCTYMCVAKPTATTDNSREFSFSFCQFTWVSAKCVVNDVNDDPGYEYVTHYIRAQLHSPQLLSTSWKVSLITSNLMYLLILTLSLT